MDFCSVQGTGVKQWSYSYFLGLALTYLFGREVLPERPRTQFIQIDTSRYLNTQPYFIHRSTHYDLLLCQLLRKYQNSFPLEALADWLIKGSINCHNTVTKFGDRCALCLVTFLLSSGQAELTCNLQSTQAGNSSGSAYENGISQASEQWVENVNQEKLRRDEEKTRRESQPDNFWENTMRKDRIEFSI